MNDYCEIGEKMRIWKENAYQFFQVTDESLVLQNFI